MCSFVYQVVAAMWVLYIQRKSFHSEKKEKKCPVSLVDPSEDLICVTSTEETCCLFWLSWF